MKSICSLKVFVAIIGFVMATLSSCGHKSVKGADGTEYDSYQSACRNQDFVAAYEWIEKNDGSEEDKDYVFNAEMLYLASLGTEEASNRIIFLLAEYQILGTPITEGTKYSSDNDYSETKKFISGIARFNKRCDKVLDMTITQGNKALAKKILDQYKGDVNVEREYTEYNQFKFGNPVYLNRSKRAAQIKYKEAFNEDIKIDSLYY